MLFRSHMPMLSASMKNRADSLLRRCVSEYRLSARIIRPETVNSTAYWLYLNKAPRVPWLSAGPGRAVRRQSSSGMTGSRFSGRTTSATHNRQCKPKPLNCTATPAGHFPVDRTAGRVYTDSGHTPVCVPVSYAADRPHARSSRCRGLPAAVTGASPGAGAGGGSVTGVIPQGGLPWLKRPE